MSPIPVRALVASVLPLAAAAPLHADIQYIFHAEITDIDADVTGSLWDGVSVGDPVTYAVTVDPGAPVTDSPNPNNRLYAEALTAYEITVGAISYAGVPDPPEHAYSGLRIVNDNPSESIATHVDTPTYDIGSQIRLDPATFDSPDIFTTPGVYLPVSPQLSYISLDDGFGGFIVFDIDSLTITPAPGAALPLVPLLPLTARRRRA